MKKIILIVVATVFVAAVCAQKIEVVSPDGRQAITVNIYKSGEGTRICWSTSFDGRAVVLPSAMELTIDNRTWERALAKAWQKDGERWFAGLEYVSHETASHSDRWHNPYGERSTVKDAWNGATVHFAKRDGSRYGLDIELRAYDEGVAFRYVLPSHPDAIYHRVKAESTEFTLPEGTKAWFAEWAQASYELRAIDGWEQAAERPLTLVLPDGTYAAIGEAGVVDFPRGKFISHPSKPGTLVTVLNDDGTDLVTPYSMPWRVVMASERPGGLLENNDIYLNLNPPSQIADESWIKPGKIMRETTLTTENSLEVIDFCARHGMDYLLYDWKWYGPSTDFASDAGVVTAPIDMEKVVAYGREKGIGIWVYVNQHALQKQAAEIFPKYREWGLAGVKFGFVQFTNQYWAGWLHELVRLAADNRLMVNIHDEYRPTGVSRTYPNLLTQEGIRGNEEFPDATHNTILPFTRMLGGAADYTVCYFDPRIKNTHAHQLALPVVFFSPLQTLYWYDTPARIREVEELEFFDNVPVVWDETRVVDDTIGEHVAIARRSGEEWFAGILGGNDACTVEIPTAFLEKGQNYVMRVYTDDESVASPTRVRTARYIVHGGDALRFHLEARGGAAMHFLPATTADLKTYKKLDKKSL